MTENSDLFAFYIITENDNLGETAHGPYTMAEAESHVKVDEKIITRKHLSTLRQQDPSITNQNSTYNQNQPQLDEKMLKEIRNWGVVLLIIGVIQVFSSGSLNNSTWGILLIIVGLSSFYFKSPAMFVIYGSTLSWAAISNAFSGAGTWTAFSLVQVFFAFQTFRQYFRFRSLHTPSQTFDEASYLLEEKNENKDKAANVFPWISLAFGIMAFGGIITVFLSLFIVIGIIGSETYPPFLDFMEGLVVDFAVIGFASGLASILSRYKLKLMSILGMIASSIVLLIEIGFAFL